MNNGVSEHIASKIIGIKTDCLLQAANIAAPPGIGNISAPAAFFQDQPSTKTQNSPKKAKTSQKAVTRPYYHRRHNPSTYRFCVIRVMGKKEMIQGAQKNILGLISMLI